MGTQGSQHLFRRREPRDILFLPEICHVQTEIEGGLFIPAKMLPGARSKLPHRCNVLPLRERAVFRQEKGTGKQGNPAQIQEREQVCVFSHNTKPRMSQERSASVADFPLDHLPFASPEATALPLFSDEVLGSRMAGSRAASGSWLAYGRAG